MVLDRVWLVLVLIGTPDWGRFSLLLRELVKFLMGVLVVVPVVVPDIVKIIRERLVEGPSTKHQRSVSVGPHGRAAVGRDQLSPEHITHLQRGDPSFLIPHPDLHLSLPLFRRLFTLVSLLRRVEKKGIGCTLRRSV